MRSMRSLAQIARTSAANLFIAIQQTPRVLITKVLVLIQNGRPAILWTMRINAQHISQISIVNCHCDKL